MNDDGERDIVPAPATYQWEMAIIVVGGSFLVRNEIRSPFGSFVFFLQPDHALAQAEALKEYALQAKSGIIKATELPKGPEGN